MTRKYHSAQGAVDWAPFDVSRERSEQSRFGLFGRTYHNKPDLQDERSKKVCEEVGRCAMGKALVDEGRLARWRWCGTSSRIFRPSLKVGM
jgi:hypothetical protein